MPIVLGAGVASSSRPSYCLLSDVLLRLYSGQGSPTGVTADPNRDSLLTTLIAAVSRRFDKETGRLPGGFTPVWDQRLYSGRGSMALETDEYAVVTKVEYLQNPGQTPPIWMDVTGDFATNTMWTLPPRVWPKTGIQRQKTFYVDPYRVGNVRVTGVWGCVEPDYGAAPPLGQTPAWGGLTDAQIIAMQPVSFAGQAGWWITPEPVVKAIAEWTVKTFKAGQAGYSDTVGNPAGGPLIYRKDIPAEVQMVIDQFTRSRPHLAMITTDGRDIADEQVYPMEQGPDAPSRWAGWASYTPSG